VGEDFRSQLARDAVLVGYRIMLESGAKPTPEEGDAATILAQAAVELADALIAELNRDEEARGE
jgi:hypothetical protein